MGDQDAEIEAGIGIMQKIAACIMLGLLVFAAIVILVLAPQNPSPTPQETPFPIPAIGLVICFVAIPFSFAIKGVLLKKTEASASIDALLSRYRAATIVALALCEGGGFALLVLTFVSGAEYVIWAAGVLLPLAGMIMHFPTRLKFDGYRAESDSKQES